MGGEEGGKARERRATGPQRADPHPLGKAAQLEKAGSSWPAVTPRRDWSLQDTAAQQVNMHLVSLARHL